MQHFLGAYAYSSSLEYFAFGFLSSVLDVMTWRSSVLVVGHRRAICRQRAVDSIQLLNDI